MGSSAIRAQVSLHHAKAARDGRPAIPVHQIVPLTDAAEVQAAAENGVVAKIVLTVWSPCG